MIPINKWAGLVTNASQYAIPPGAAVEQVNLQCLVPGQLTVRPGMASVTLPIPSTATTSIVRAFRYQHGSAEHIVYQDAQGNIYSSVVAAGAVTATSPPAAPTITSALPGNTTIAVSLTAPAATGGSAITGYSFQVSTDNGTTWSAAGSSAGVSHTIVGLTNGTGYRVRAAANNSAGQGDYSSSFGPVSPRAPVVGPASPPSLVSATASAFNTATVSWYTPTDNGGSVITGYSIQQSSDRGLTWSTSSSVGLVSTATVSGLAASTDFVFRVAAITSYGTGQYSAASNAVSIVGATTTPSQPQNLSGIATTTSVTLSWGAPTSDGGSAITGYSIRYGTSSQGPWTVQSAAGLTGTVTGLSSNTRYTFGVFASNANGGGQIASLDVTTLAAVANTAPSSPTNLVLTRTADGFSATWDAPASTGGSAITAYRLTTSSSQTGPETQVYNSLTRSYTATGLTAGSLVWVSVYAVNAVGSSTAMRTTVGVGIAPSAPLNFTATPTNTQVALSWSPPASLYGQQVTAYVLAYSVGYGEQVAGNATSKTLVPISGQPYVSGASYTYTIHAVTAAGSGTTASVTFTVPAAPAVPPSAPQNLVLTPKDGGFTASWDAPADSGSSPITSYALFYNPPAVFAPPLAATARTATVSGLTNGVVVNVQLLAYSAAGNGRAMGAVTPYSAATAPRNLTYSLAYVLADRATVSLSWTAPSSLGGLALTRYVIYKDGVEYTASSTTASTITQLPSTATYTVYAQTSAGLSPVSNAVTVTAAAPTAPAPPTLSLVSSSSGELQFTAYSVLPAGMSSISYAGQFSLNSGGTWQAATLTLSAIEGGSVKFLCSIPYAGSASRAVLGRAQATASAGGVSKTSAWSSAISAFVTFSPPVFSPSITSVDLEDIQTKVSWTAASASGGSAVTGYTVRYKRGGTVLSTQTVAPSVLTATFSRTESSGDAVEILAVNAVGSTTASLVLPRRFSAPPNVVINANTEGAVLLSWGVIAYADGRTVDGYVVSRSVDNTTWTTVATPTARSVTLTSQPLGTRSSPVYYRIVATAGSDTSSPTVRQTPTAPGRPGLSNLDYNCSLPELIISPPTYNGGAALSTYSIDIAQPPLGTSLSTMSETYWRTFTTAQANASSPVTVRLSFSNSTAAHYARVVVSNAAGNASQYQTIVLASCSP